MSRYWYFASTLPSFAFGAPPPMSSEDFLARCEAHLDPADFVAVSTLLDRVFEGGAPESSGLSPFAAAYLEWERGFRNELARMRARKTGMDEERYTRECRISGDALRSAATVAAVEDPLQAEVAFEKERWASAERCSSPSPFGEDAILAYRVKLDIAQRLAGLEAEAGRSHYKALHDDILGGAASLSDSGNETAGERA